MKQKKRLIYELNAARHSMMKKMDAVCWDELGISVVQLTTLMAVNEQNGCLMKDLAKDLMLDKSAVTGLAKRMQSADLITKVSCDKDSRATRLVITDQGKELLKRGFVLLEKANKMIKNDFNEQELETISRFLRHITNTFSEEE